MGGWEGVFSMGLWFTAEKGQELFAKGENCKWAAYERRLTLVPTPAICINGSNVHYKNKEILILKHECSYLGRSYDEAHRNR